MTRSYKRIKFNIVVFLKMQIVRILTSCIPLNQKKFFCISMTGNSYGDSIKCLSDYIVEHHSSSTIIWAFTDTFYKLTNCEHKKVKLYSFMYYYHILTSKYVLSNVSLSKRMLVKRKGQICIQTWHGTTLKRIGIDMYSHRERSWSDWFSGGLITEYNAKLTDLLVSGSQYMTKILHEKCLYPMNVIHEIGTPRNDIFFQEKPEVVNKVRELYGINKGTKIILYAPTFRTGGDFSYYDVDLRKIQSIFEKRYGDKYLIMVRLHPNLLRKETDFYSIFPSRTINASSYPDMIDLLYTVDVLVTDYSSCMFDFVYSFKPVIMYVPDRNIYDRGFYFDIDELPFVIINDNSEINQKLAAFNEVDYKTKVDVFFKKIGSVENGVATAKLYELIKTYKK